MSVRNLDALFAPSSVVLIGASERPRSVGATVLRNLLAGGYRGSIQAVNPKHRSVQGIDCHRSVAVLPTTPDLAVICTPAASVPGLIDELGRRGTRAAIVMSAGMSQSADAGSGSLAEQMLAAARPYLLRVLGPNCLGLIQPALGLNASFAHRNAEPGQLAFVSQSGAMMTAVLDWAASRGIGFSKCVSLGDGADVDFGDILDYLASDAQTRGILLYIEAVTAARKFMSAARAAARNKPVLVVKSGRAPEGARAAMSHTGALAGSDAVYDAAIRRAGMLRVATTEDLFDAVETLARSRPLQGERLAILTNGGGPGVLAADALSLAGGHLAELSAATRANLDACLPPTWSHGNPIDVIGDAPAERYVQALDVLLREPSADAVLLIHAPVAVVASADIATAVIPSAMQAQRNVLTCWLGADAVTQARQACESAGLPTYSTPENAVRAFLHLVEYRRNQALLMEVPPSAPKEEPFDLAGIRTIIHTALDAGRDTLSAPEAQRVLQGCGIAVVESRTADSAEEAVVAAAEIGFPVALKILSPQISHKSDVGGVRLDLPSAEAVCAAANAMLAHVRSARPEAELLGFHVQSMAVRPHARELIVGIADDKVFGPVVLFGHGGKAVERIADRSMALPPLNTALAHELIQRTRIAKLLDGYRDQPAADSEAIAGVLVKVARLVADVPQIAELDINPLLADEHGVLALDARIRIADGKGSGLERFAIKPYPSELEEWIDWQGERVLLRPIRPQDAEQHVAFFDALSADDVRSRMFIRLRELPRSELARLTQIDYDREMAFIAVRERGSGRAETLGVVRALADPDNIVAEFAIIVRSDLKERGLGTLLLDKLLRYCRARGTARLVGEALIANARMHALAQRFGFKVAFDADSGTTRMSLELGGQPVDPSPRRGA